MNLRKYFLCVFIFFVFPIITSWASQDVQRCAFDGYQIWNTRYVTDTIGGKNHYFCAKNCRDLFLRNHSQALFDHAHDEKTHAVHSSSQKAHDNVVMLEVSQESHQSWQEDRRSSIDRDLDRAEALFADSQLSQSDSWKATYPDESQSSMESLSKEDDWTFLKRLENNIRKPIEPEYLVSSDGNQRIPVKRWSIDAGVAQHDYLYKEPEVDVKTDGGHSEVEAIVTYQKVWEDEILGNDSMDATWLYTASLGLRGYAGEVDYTGSGTYDGLDDHGYEVRALGGSQWLAGGHVFYAYTGFGLRKLYNELAEIPARTIDGNPYASGYDRDSEYLYLPLGLTVKNNFQNKWSLTTSLEYDHLLRGEQISHLEQTRDLNGDPTGYQRLKNKQENGFGLRFSLRLAKTIGMCDFYIEPFLRYWHIDDSELSLIVVDGVGPVGVGLEPENTTREAGLKVGVSF